MNITLSAVLLEAAVLEPESAFWHQLLGGSISRTQIHHFLRGDGFPAIVIQLAPRHLPPQWPDGRSQQMHIDLTVGDLAAADHLATGAGARRLAPESDVASSPASADARRGDAWAGPGPQEPHHDRWQGRRAGR